MRKSSKRKNKNRGLFIAVLAVLAVGIGFAALQKYLTIDGTASINSNFNVRIDRIETGDITGGAYNKKDPSYTDTTATFDAAFLAPGDSISYIVDVENSGTMNAKLENMDVNIDDNENISYEITGIQTGDIIPAPAYKESLGDGDCSQLSTCKQITLKLTYTGESSEITTSNVKVTLKFVQTNEKSDDQTSAISLIENEKPVFEYEINSVTTENEVKVAKLSLSYNSENRNKLEEYYLGTEVYRKYASDKEFKIKDATQNYLNVNVAESLNTKIRYVYSINGVKYYSQYSDEKTINIQSNEGFVYNDYNYILATDDSYFNDGIMTLPVGRKFLRMTSKKITKVIIPENYNLQDLGERSLSSQYATSLKTIVNKTGNSVNWAPIVGLYGDTNCEFESGTCAGIEIITSE